VFIVVVVVVVAAAAAVAVVYFVIDSVRKLLDTQFYVPGEVEKIGRGWTKRQDILQSSIRKTEPDSRCSDRDSKPVPSE
jgi:hypothetical protein